jgi:hypothetical protein
MPTWRIPVLGFDWSGSLAGRPGLLGGSHAMPLYVV